jgi:hypothetical protein
MLPTLDLPDEIHVQIFLRFPADEPACLVHASLISRFWFNLLSGDGFRGMYDAFHGDPQ